MRNKIKALPLLVGVILLSVVAVVYANVNLMNGNFYIGFTDLVYGGGLKPKIERIYNSKTPHKGIFGWGWGTEYEVRLQESLGGSVIIFQYGGGAESEFWPADVDAQGIADAIEQMVEANRPRFTTPSQVVAYRDSLNADGTFRRDEWQRLVQAGTIEQPRVVEQSKLAMPGSTDEQVTRTADGYTRKLPNGKLETFNALGRLARVEDGTGNFINIEYDDAGRMLALTDNLQRTIKLDYNARGLVTSAVGSADGKRSEYRYDDRDNLIWSKDTGGNVHEYEYDDRHNMTRIGYDDGTSMRIRYNMAFNEHVAGVVDREGKQTEYTYETDPQRAGWLRVIEKVTQAGDAVDEAQTTTYEYTTRVKASGEEWVQRIVQENSWQRTETTYNECCALPLEIAKSARGDDGEWREPRVTRFVYNDKGRLLEKTLPAGDVIRLTYAEAVDKIATVFAQDAYGDTMTTVFAYDAKGNLVRAQNKDHDIKLVYNDNAKIERMISPDGVLTFKYNAMGKPIEITDPEMGSLHVTYDDNGEIAKVDAGEGGHQMSLRITQRFQNLLAAVKPADLSVPCQDTKSCPRRSRPERSDQALGQMPESAYLGAANRSQTITF